MKREKHFAQVIVLWAILSGIPISFAQVSPVNLFSPSGSFNTPTFPSRYPPATEYTWLIKAKYGMFIKLTFDIMDIEAYRGKCIDIVEIKDGDDSEAAFIGGFCNGNKPKYSITSSSNALRIWFQSARNSDGGAGFNASYTTLKDEVCGGQLRSFPGSFSTPHYPNPYPNDRKCVWDIMAPKGVYIYVKFHGTYHLEVQCFFGECICKDTLDIKDGNKDLPYPPHDGYCFAKPHAFTSKTNSVSFKFVTNNGGRFEGFNVTYSTSLTPGCGGDLQGDMGIITSPMFPHSYHSSSKCIWRITVATGYYVTLKFQKFDVNEIHNKCLVDSLKIHEGFTRNSPLLAQLCNANSVDMINSSGNQLYIEFTAGVNKNATGFKATYTSHLKAESDTTNRKPRHNHENEQDLASKEPSNIASNVFTSASVSLFSGFFGILVVIL